MSYVIVNFYARTHAQSYFIAARLIVHIMPPQTLIVDLTRSLDEPQDSANLQIAVLSFFNAIINYKAGQVRR